MQRFKHTTGHTPSVAHRSYVFYFTSCRCLKRQVVGRRRCQIGCGRSRRERRYIVGHRRHVGHGLSCRNRLLYLPSPHIGIPAPIVFTAFEIETHNHIVANRCGILIYLITKKIETHFARILLLGFQYILLFLPRITGFRNTFLQRQHMNDSSFNFHIEF